MGISRQFHIWCTDTHTSYILILKCICWLLIRFKIRSSVEQMSRRFSATGIKFRMRRSLSPFYTHFKLLRIAPPKFSETFRWRILRTVTSYRYAVVGSSYCLFTWRTTKQNASCRLLVYETRHVGRMWMWLHIWNVVCEQEAKKFCSELELSWVCENDAFNKHMNAHIHKVKGYQTVTVALCTRYSGHLRILWRHQPRTFQKATIHRRPNALKPNDPYLGRTAPLTSRRCILYIYSKNILTE